jgi:hypothetical protein
VVNVNAALSMVGSVAFETGMSYTLSIVPLFILMGNLVTRAGLSSELYRVSYAFLGHRRGGLAMATILACGGFGAVCGSSLATAATMSKVAMPSMRKYGYSDALAAGSIAAGGTLGILIPPSVVMVIYGILTETEHRQAVHRRHPARAGRYRLLPRRRRRDGAHRRQGRPARRAGDLARAPGRHRRRLGRADPVPDRHRRHLRRHLHADRGGRHRRRRRPGLPAAAQGLALARAAHHPHRERHHHRHDLHHPDRRPDLRQLHQHDRHAAGADAITPSISARRRCWSSSPSW